VEDSSEHGSQEVTLLTREGRVTLNVGIQVTAHYLLNLSRSNNVLRPDVGELDPIVQEIISHPEDRRVASYTTSFARISEISLHFLQLTADHPVVIV